MGPSGRRARVQILFVQLFVAPRAGAWVETLCVVFLPRFLPPGHFLLLNRFRALFTRLACQTRADAADVANQGEHTDPNILELPPRRAQISNANKFVQLFVAPRAGAWIETK